MDFNVGVDQTHRPQSIFRVAVVGEEGSGVGILEAKGVGGVGAQLVAPGVGQGDARCQVEDDEYLGFADLEQIGGTEAGFFLGRVHVDDCRGGGGEGGRGLCQEEEDDGEGVAACFAAVPSLRRSEARPPCGGIGLGRGRVHCVAWLFNSIRIVCLEAKRHAVTHCRTKSCLFDGLSLSLRCAEVLKYYDAPRVSQLPAVTTIISFSASLGDRIK